MEYKKEHDGKIEAGEIVVKNRFFTWLDNFWYHHKWGVIVVSFFLFLGIVCFAQCSSKPDGDVMVAYAGGYTLNGEERNNIVQVLESIAPEKGDSGKPLTLLLNDFSVYTEDELKKLYTDDAGELVVSAYNNAKQVNKDNLKTFGTYVMTGECGVWFVSEYVYKQQNLSKLAVPLSELYGDKIPSGAYDDCAVRLAETELYQYYDVLKVLPEDTLIVLPQSFVWGSSANQEVYNEFRELYLAILSFKKT